MGRGFDPEPTPWNTEIEKHVTDFAVAGYLDLRDAPKRHAELLRIHQQGWASVANAISTGLGQIAKAIRDGNR